MTGRAEKLDLSSIPLVISPLELRRVRNIMEENVSNTVEVFKTLSDPIRIKILKMLEKMDLCVCVLVDATGLEYSTLSYHLKKLKSRALIESRQEGNFLIYSLTGSGRKIIDNLLKMKHEY